MKTANNRSRFSKGLKIIASVHLVGFLGIALAVGLFFAVAQGISDSGQTLVDMRGFQLVEAASNITNAGASQELIVDLARWDTAGGVWTSDFSTLTPFSAENSAIKYYLPAYAQWTGYYIYTFPDYGNWSAPPTGWDDFFKGFGTCNLIKIEFDYTLLRNIDSLNFNPLTFYFRQYDDKECIDSQYWSIPASKGSHNFTTAVNVLPEAKSFRVYLYFVSFTQNEITLHSLKLINMHGYNLFLTEVENNFKKLSFTLHLSRIAECPDLIVFRKDADLKGRSDYQNLRFFVSVDTGKLDKTLLSFLKINVFFDKVLVWSVPVSKIGNPTFVEQNVAEEIKSLNGKKFSEIYLTVSCDSPDPATQKEIMGQSIHISVAYLDIR